MCGHHSIIYPIPINIFNTLHSGCETEWSTFCCVCEVLENLSFTDTLNIATIIEKQLNISVVYDHHRASNTVFENKVKWNKYIYIYIYTHTFTISFHSVGFQKFTVFITIQNHEICSIVADCCRIIFSLVKMYNG
jgi:hypothetical protein